MFDWITKLSGDQITFLIGTFAGVVTWIYHKARGEKTQTFREIVQGFVDNLIEEAIDNYDGRDLATFMNETRNFIRMRSWTILRKLGVPRNNTTELLLNAALERGTVRLARWIQERVADKKKNSQPPPIPLAPV